VHKEVNKEVEKIEDTPPYREQWAVVVLAAGRSSRMGEAKQLVLVDGEQMVRRAVRVALASGATEVVLVTGAYGNEVAAAVDDLHEQAAGRLHVIHNPGWATGQAGSMQVGIRALPVHCEAVIFLPVDQPYVDPLLLRQLVAAWQQGAVLAAPIVDSELRGAPALFDRTLWPELNQVQGDVGGRMVLRAHADQVHRIAAPAAWLRDVDTPQDLVA
jgi:molybdenum cofactor cytidylyltransferase